MKKLKDIVKPHKTKYPPRYAVHHIKSGKKIKDFVNLNSAGKYKDKLGDEYEIRDND